MYNFHYIESRKQQFVTYDAEHRFVRGGVSRQHPIYFIPLQTLSHICTRYFTSFLTLKLLAQHPNLITAFLSTSLSHEPQLLLRFTSPLPLHQIILLYSNPQLPSSSPSSEQLTPRALPYNNYKSQYILFVNFILLSLLLLLSTLSTRSSQI